VANGHNASATTQCAWGSPGDGQLEWLMARALVLAVSIFLAAETAPALSFVARVERIADGDSFTVRAEGGRIFEVRINGIDAPERRQAFGPTARTSLHQLIGGRQLVIDVDTVDRYGRLIARVRHGAIDVGLAQIEAGYAWSYPWADALPEAEKKRYAAAERRARLAHAGLWAAPEPVAPWVFRRDARAANDRPAQRTPVDGAVIGNRRSKVYHRRDCPGYAAVSEKNRIAFASATAAEMAGYRLAGNCRE
jgi:micrococcal nuclease